MKWKFSKTPTRIRSARIMVVAAALCFTSVSQSQVPAPPVETPENGPAGDISSPEVPIVVTGDLTPAEDREVIVCKRLDPNVGTRLQRKKVCKAKREWAQEEAANKEVMQDTLRRGLIKNGPG